MSQNKIIALPHPSLRKKSRDCTVPSDNVRKLVAEMIGATLDWEASRKHEVGVALAAVQINRLDRVIIIRSEPHNKDNGEFQVFINPSITRYEGEPVTDLEGCLSVKDVYGKVARYPKVKVKALDLEGRPIKKVVKGFAARVFQHEVDHTNGKTFLDQCGTDGQYFYIEDDGNMRELTDAERKKFLKTVGYV